MYCSTALPWAALRRVARHVHTPGGQEIHMTFLGGTKGTADPSLFSVGTAILAIHTMSSLIVAMSPLLFPILFATRRLYRANKL